MPPDNVLAFSTTLIAIGQDAKPPGVDTAMQEMIAKHEIAGAVTAVVTRDAVLHLDTAGFADLAAKRPMLRTRCSGSPR